ncbi:hypothetical protein [Glycomyces sp. NPDC021274]|uniref:hypothetical protein n=1 Tax=Glycomyces sp. NPDC021274 TaxID=3155120 RepID=UPI0033EDC1CA
MQYRFQLVNVSETAAAIARLGENAYDAVEDAAERGGQWVTFQARDILRGQTSGTYLPHYPRSITAEVERSAGMVSMIVGPETGKPQGGMGLGIEWGSVNAPPFPHLNPAFDDRVESIIDRAANNLARWPDGRSR